MSDPPRPLQYSDVYRNFDAPVMRQVRREAHGEDIGQHSWVTAEELSADIHRLQLSPASRLLDLGCGPCGPLTFVAANVGCRGTGVDFSAEAIAAGRTRVVDQNLEGLLTLHVADLNQSMPFEAAVFDAVISIDVILHLHDRRAIFQEVVRVLISGGRFLFTDAAVVTGAISSYEIEQRALHGPTQFVPPGYNERLLEESGFRLLEQHDRTASLRKKAAGRLAARLSYRAEIEALEGPTVFARQLRYLETIEATSRRGALSRIMYVAESATS